MHRQEEGEPVDSLITSLTLPASKTLQLSYDDEMIRYRIIVGLQDSNPSERLQTYPELNLDKAITMARQTEAVRDQQAVIRGEADNTCTRIKEAEHSYSNEKTTNCVPSQQDSKAAKRKGYTRCSSFQHIQVPGS